MKLNQSLSALNRSLRAHEKLSKLLAGGGSDQEIADGMKELREALDNYMREVAEQQQERQDYCSAPAPEALSS